MSRVTSIAVLLGLAVAVPTGARADESVWAGNGSGTWSTASSWVGSHIPGSSDNVSLKGWEPLLRTSWTISASNTNGGNPTTNAKDGHL
ncbi:MAG TPA: hypothetical protein VH374_14890, partial [Polyangia bacterium]|nr:hypothetical protein [Polyangia bacterium]